MAMGATTYEWVVDHEKLVERPERWHEFYGDTPTWVFAHRELTAVPGLDIRVVQGDVVPVHAAMVEAAGDKNVWLVGGGELVGAFADAGLLDEIWLGMQPVFLGAGAPLLPRTADLEAHPARVGPEGRATGACSSTASARQGAAGGSCA